MGSATHLLASALLLVVARAAAVEAAALEGEQDRDVAVPASDLRPPPAPGVALAPASGGERAVFLADLERAPLSGASAPAPASASAAVYGESNSLDRPGPLAKMFNPASASGLYENDEDSGPDNARPKRTLFKKKGFGGFGGGGGHGGGYGGGGGLTININKGGGGYGGGYGGGGGHCCGGGGGGYYRPQPQPVYVQPVIVKPVYGGGGGYGGGHKGGGYGGHGGGHGGGGGGGGCGYGGCGGGCGYGGCGGGGGGGGSYSYSQSSAQSSSYSGSYGKK